MQTEIWKPLPRIHFSICGKQQKIKNGEAVARMEGLDVGKGDAQPADQASVSLLSHVLKAHSSYG